MTKAFSDQQEAIRYAANLRREIAISRRNLIVKMRPVPGKSNVWTVELVARVR